MKIRSLLLAGMLSVLAGQAAAIDRKDVLECVLPGGGRATLTSRYDESLLAKMVPADLSKRLNQEPWTVAFHAVAGRSVPRPPLSVSHVLGSEACSHIGIIDGVAVAKMSYLRPDGRWFQHDAIPKALLLEPGRKSQPPEIRARLETIGAMPVLDYALIFPRAGRLIYELPLINIKQGQDGRVVAVFQSSSSDGGANWSEPQITRNSEIYVLDQLPFRQPFQGRAVKLNGKEIRSE